MRRLSYLLYAALIIAALALAGCGSQAAAPTAAPAAKPTTAPAAAAPAPTAAAAAAQPTTAPAKPAAAGAPAVAPTPATAGDVSAIPALGAGPSITMKMSSYGNEKYPIRIFMEKIKVDLESKSNGRIKIEFYPNETLLKNTEGFAGVQKNLAQFAMTSAAYEPDRLGILADIANLPWNWNYNNVGNAMRGPGGFYEFAAAKYEKQGIKLLSWPNVPSGEIFSRKPIQKLEDLKGQMIRSVSSVFPWLKAVGAAPVDIPPSELYTAVQRGTVDGGTVATSSILSGKYFEVGPYTVISGLYTGSLPMIMNLEYYNNLPADVRQLLDAVILAEEKWYNAVLLPRTGIEDMERLKAEPKEKLYVLPPDELARWKAVQEGLNKDLEKKWGAEWQQFSAIRAKMQ